MPDGKKLKKKRLGRCLVGVHRLVQRLERQDPPFYVVALSDSDHTGCRRTRRSASCDCDQLLRDGLWLTHVATQVSFSKNGLRKDTSPQVNSQAHWTNTQDVFSRKARFQAITTFLSARRTTKPIRKETHPATHTHTLREGDLNAPETEKPSAFQKHFPRRRNYDDDYHDQDVDTPPVGSVFWSVHANTQASCCEVRVSCGEERDYCVGCDIVKGDHAPDGGVAQGVIHGDVIRHHGRNQEEVEEELGQEVKGQEEDNTQEQVRMTMTMDEMERHCEALEPM